MFTQALENLAEPRLKEKWMPKVKSCEIIGTYAQTELGHGTIEIFLYPSEGGFCCLLHEQQNTIKGSFTAIRFGLFLLFKMLNEIACRL